MNWIPTRKTLREATIFALLGMAVATLGCFILLEQYYGKTPTNEALKAIHASTKPMPLEIAEALGRNTMFEVSPGLYQYAWDEYEYHGYDGTILYVRICGGGTPSNMDCWRDQGASEECHRTPLSENCIKTTRASIAKQALATYKKAKTSVLLQNFLGAPIIGLLGVPLGLGVWMFYRLVKFAVKG